MSAAYTAADMTRLAAVPSVRDADSDERGDEMNGFEVVTNAALDAGPDVCRFALIAFTTAAAVAWLHMQMGDAALLLDVFPLRAGATAIRNRFWPSPPESPPAVHTPARPVMSWRSQ